MSCPAHCCLGARGPLAHARDASPRLIHLPRCTPFVILNEKSIAPDRPALVRRGLWLNYATIAYNSVEGIVSIVAGFVAGSVALVGFGVDSVIEVTASGAAQWRLRVDHDAPQRERVERASVRIIGACFIALALYVGTMPR